MDRIRRRIYVDPRLIGTDTTSGKQCSIFCTERQCTIDSDISTETGNS